MVAYVFPANYPEGSFSNRVRDRFIARNEWLLDEGYDLEYTTLSVERFLSFNTDFTIVNIKNGDEVVNRVVVSAA